MSAQQYFSQTPGEDEERYVGLDVLAKLKGASLLAEYFSVARSAVTHRMGFMCKLVT